MTLKFDKGPVYCIAFTLSLLAMLVLINLWKVADAEQQARNLSDAQQQTTLRIAVDSWVGYFPLCSPAMKRAAYRHQLRIQCLHDDDIVHRFAGLGQGQYDLAVGTVDSFLLNGEASGYSSLILAVLDESQGGDGVVAWRDQVAHLEALKGPQKHRIALVGNSPSHHLLKTLSAHFDLPGLLNHSRLQFAASAEAALTQFTSRQVAVAVLWEPELSAALNHSDVVELFNSRHTHSVIVDVLMGSHALLQRQPALVRQLLNSYFAALSHYQTHPDALIVDLQKHYQLSSPAQAQRLIAGVSWASLRDNLTHWLGPDDALAGTLRSTEKILLAAGDFSAPILPDDNPHRLIGGRWLTSLTRQSPREHEVLPTDFSRLSEREWDSLREVGLLKRRALNFSRGRSEMSLNNKYLVDGIMTDLSHYPQFRVEIRGHTSTSGDPTANQRLSYERAQAVLRYLSVTYEIDPQRFRAIGLGDSRPLPRQKGEALRRYHYRLPRVEFALLEEDAFFEKHERQSQL